MYELNGTIQGVSVDYQTGKALLTLSVNQKQSAINCFDALHLEEKLSFKIDKHREKRSLNANAYCWKLLTEIANKLLADKEQIYLLMLKRYGQREMISVQAHIPISEYVKYCEEAGESKLNGKLFKHYFVYKGSSEFDAREMSIFIDGVVSEAKELGIPTDTPDQIAKMKSLWGE
jgi:hypothetical protein